MKKTRDFYFFMTKLDEMAFCEALRNGFSKVFFLDTEPTFESDIDKRLYESIKSLDSRFFSIVNFEFVEKDKLKNAFEKYGEYYHFFQIGRGQIQFLRSNVDKDNNLQAGRLCDCYETEDELDKKWKDSVYKLLKKMGHKIYWYYHDENNNPKSVEKPDNRHIALHDAFKEYNGELNFMCHDSAKYIDINNFKNIIKIHDGIK